MVFSGVVYSFSSLFFLLFRSLVPVFFKVLSCFSNFLIFMMSKNEPEFGKIVAKAWRDPAFKAELIANPAATLKAEGIDGVRYEC